MGKRLISVGLDIGTTTTQLVVSSLQVENKASAFSVPEMEIADRQILYKSPIHFTPLIGEHLVDGERIRQLVAQEYASAGIRRDNIDTGAIIITGETSRKENAAVVVDALSEYAGDFVVATAGPHLESVLAAKGAGADAYAQRHEKTVLHMDIGGGTTNLALIRNGTVCATGCLNIGGRLLKFDENERIRYRSPVLQDMEGLDIGQKPSTQTIQKLCESMSSVLEMAAGLRPPSPLLTRFWTKEAGNPWLPPTDVEIISFSGGVSECIETSFSPLSFGDIGPVLGQAIKKSRLCNMPYRLGSETIRATVIGAGSHTTQLSGSTVFYQNITFPIKNLPVVSSFSALSQLDGPGVLTRSGFTAGNYAEIISLADEIATYWPDQPVFIAMEADMAKALGHALALRMGAERGILCIDRVRLGEESYLDVGCPIGSALPVVIKTLVMER